MSSRLRWVLIGGCALLGLLDGPTAGLLLAQGLDGAYADEPEAVEEQLEAVLPAADLPDGALRDEVDRVGLRAGRLIELELVTWRGGLASGL